MYDLIVNNLGLIESGLTFLIVVGFCAYQYWSVSRSLETDRSRAAGHSEGQEALDNGGDEAVE